MAVMIGVDSHKGCHTGVALDGSEQLLGEVKVRASSVQTQRLVEWAAAWPERTWAVETSWGLGYLLGEGKTPPKDAVRALKRGISDVVYRQLRLAAERRFAAEQAREGKRGATSRSFRNDTERTRSA